VRLALTGLVAVAVVAVLAALWRFAFLGAPPSSMTQTAIAVFPFSVNGSGEFAYLGKGMVDLLSTNLNGAGDLRAVDAHAVLGSVAFAPASLTPQQGSALAERLGAGLFVTGGVVESVGLLRIGATLYVRARPGTPLARATVEGKAERLFELVDDLTTQLLAARRGGPGGRLTRLAAVTTRSLPALKLYLEGEEHLRAGRFDSAMQSFDQASAQDTLFALAYYRRAVAADWAANFEAARDAAEEAIRFSSRLSEDDRSLLQAFLAWHRGDAAAAEQLYRTVLRDHPDNVEAWYNLGEVLFHYSGVRGGSMMQARPAFERALYLDPQMSDARLHLIDIAAKQRDFTRFDTLLSQLRTEGPVRLRRRAILAFATGSRERRDSAIGELRLANDPTVIIASWGTGIYLEQLADAERIASLLLEPARTPETQAYARVLLAQFALGRGRWRASELQLDSLAAADPTMALEYRALLSIAPFAPVTDDSLRALQRQLAQWDAAATKPAVGSTSAIRVHNGVHPLLRLYLLGAVSARLHDERTAEGAERELRRVGEAPLPPRAGSADSVVRNFAADLALGVRTQRAWYADRPQDALTAAEHIRSQAPLERIANSPFYPHLPERFLRAEALHRLGRDREAAGFYASLQEGRFDAIYLAPTHLRLAEIAEHANDAQAAVLHYGRVVDLWGSGDPAAREVVARARVRLAALRKD
jgi:tetratricopeptide (TPR) repeat protein